eukprot:TRINITY_DN1002_c0_g1_i2.p1 TRINITY_DN1002_c0_g1~~TRINITY_DN1002_c0_g1_i2.p1  ORF type:complete len:291 (+),score=33.21 TRINITY_DN1002_c0_g1_i2:86-958(+)
MAQNRVAVVFGASRGIGACIAITLAKNNYSVVLCAKTVAPTSEKIGGDSTIHTVAQTIKSQGGTCIALPCDVRDENSILKVVQETLREYGRLDYCIYNAGAILWNKVSETPFKKFDLMNQVNLRGCYAVISSVLPIFQRQQTGRFLIVSPPIYSRFFRGKTPYAATKIGMSVLVQGLGMELQGSPISICALWPASGIRSAVTDKQNIPLKLLRTPEIFADAVLAIGDEAGGTLNGQCLLDEDYLVTKGVHDFTKYRCDPTAEPPRMMPRTFPDLTVAEQHDRGVFVTSKL